MSTWHVYQLLGETELLYVGNSRWLKRRLADHRRDKSWWPEVTGVSSEEFATEDEARQREKELWAGGRPKYNQVSPFLTEQESREYDRARERGRVRKETPEQADRRRQRVREYMREYNRRPEVVERYRLRYLSGKSHPNRRQADPGLF
jgi:predicted GIY-YIG superfamily endonuclease